MQDHLDGLCANPESRQSGPMTICPLLRGDVTSDDVIGLQLGQQLKTKNMDGQEEIVSRISRGGTGNEN